MSAIEHCARHGYDEEYERAEIRLEVLAQKFPVTP